MSVADTARVTARSRGASREAEVGRAASAASAGSPSGTRTQSQP